MYCFVDGSEKDGDVEVVPYKKHFFSIITQNDSYFSVYIDRYYTTGQGLLYSSKEGSYKFLDFLGLVKGVSSFSVAINQSIYAPKDRKAIFPEYKSHPYGGYTNVGFFWHHRSKDILENIGIRIGVTGRISFAQEVQDFVHGLIGSIILRGWDTQIHNEFILNGHYDWTYRYKIADFWNFSLDMLPNVEFALGNANIYAKGGVVFRIGRNLETTFLPQGIAGENGGLNTGRVFKDGVGYYLFFGVNGGYVARKLFIQGNSFSSYQRADLIHWVGSLVAGISIVSGRMSFTYQAVYTSKEFQKQDMAHGIGSLNFSWSF
ncbi:MULTISPECIES: lipid A deacylase LpxR family protein [unclassified Helicobacter]|uniref:lipid A deacylase LpxR family protein n=1 Tax=unclassified Helicobacter TaxID=2593540 RepID=UPI0013157A94|nr:MULTISPECIES: lipid A deacylase LpxR family protein [unclassified Helicobacter]